MDLPDDTPDAGPALDERGERLARIEAVIRSGVYPDLIDLAWLCTLVPATTPPAPGDDELRRATDWLISVAGMAVRATDSVERDKRIVDLRIGLEWIAKARADATLGATTTGEDE